MLQIPAIVRMWVTVGLAPAGHVAAAVAKNALSASAFRL